MEEYPSGLRGQFAKLLAALPAWVRIPPPPNFLNIKVATHMINNISIIIPNYNGLDLLKKNIPSIINNIDKGIEAEIILVDNGSKDTSVPYIRSAFPNIIIIPLEKNKWVIGALNMGAKTAKHDHILFLNNDIEVTGGYLLPLLEHFKDPDVFGVSPRVIRPSNLNATESIITGLFKGGVIGADYVSSQYLNISDPVEVFSVCGAAFVVDKKKFFELGGLDEMLSPFYFEETDLSYRALKRGWKIIHEPKSIVYHQHNQTIGKQFKTSFALWTYRKNQYLTVWKNISDPFLIIKHVIQMVMIKLLVPNITEWKALFSAFKQLPDVLKRRQQLKATNRLTDKAIFEMAKEQKRRIDQYVGK